VIVVDTSVLVDFFRGRATPAGERLRQLELDEVPFAIPAICCQEVLGGARDEREWDLLRSYLETQHLLLPEDPWRVHRDAARIMFDCRRQGVTIRGSVDCLIAQLVLDTDGALLHSDADFDRIKAVRPLRTILE
jgi:predicted nucleic acid-binding protein